MNRTAVSVSCVLLSPCACSRTLIKQRRQWIASSTMSSYMESGQVDIHRAGVYLVKAWKVIHQLHSIKMARLRAKGRKHYDRTAESLCKITTLNSIGTRWYLNRKISISFYTFTVIFLAFDVFYPMLNVNACMIR